MAQKLNLVINQGETFELDIIAKDLNKQPIDITNYSYAGKIRSAYDSDVIAAFTFTKAEQRNSTLGWVKASLTPAQTQAIPCVKSSAKNKRPLTEYIYDIEETDPSNNVTRILEGIISVSPSVTW